MLHLGGVGKYMSQIQDCLSIQGIWGSTHPCGNIPNVEIKNGRKEKVKRENLKRETRGPVARPDWQKGLCAYRVPDACMSTLVGFMVGIWVVFGVVVSPVFRTGIPVVTELVLGGAATEPPEAHIHYFGLAGHNCFVGNSRGG
jgi:hypothetical protein